MEDEDAAKEARVVFLQTTHKGSQQVLIPGELSSDVLLMHVRFFMIFRIVRLPDRTHFLYYEIAIR